MRAKPLERIDRFLKETVTKAASAEMNFFHLKFF